MKRKPTALRELSADDFLNGAFPASTAESSNEEDAAPETLDGGSGESSGESESSEEQGSETVADADVAEDGDCGDGGSSDDEDVLGAGRHAAELRALAEKDPEFYEYLRAEEPGLLEFGDGDSGSDGEGDMAAAGVTDPIEVEGGDGSGKSSRRSRSTTTELTMPLLRGMFDEAFKCKTVSGLKRLIAAFRCGCHLGDENQRGGGDGDGDGDGAGRHGSSVATAGLAKYSITTSEVYNALMMRCLSDAQKTFLHHLYPNGPPRPEPSRDKGGKVAAAAMAAANGRPSNRNGSDGDDKPTPAASKSAKATAKAAVAASAGLSAKAAATLQGAAPAKAADTRLDPTGLKRAMKAAPPALSAIMLSFYRSLLHVLTQLKDRELLSFVLQRLERHIPLLSLFPRLGRTALRALLAHWGTASVATGEEASVQILSFLRLRELSATQPFPFLEDCLRSVYLAFARNAKFTSEQTRPAVAFMTNCVVELYGFDGATAYQVAFVYVRQLALHLRQALRKGTSEAYHQLYKWQVFNCLRLWTAVVSAYPGEDQLRLLIYPLSQVVAGIARLVPSPRFFPMRFQCVRLLQELAAAARCYSPTAALLLPVLECPALAKRPKPSTEAPPVVALLLKLGRDAILERPAQDAVVSEALRLLRVEQELYRYAPAYPEVALPLLARLRRFAKQTKVAKWRLQTRGLVDIVQRYSAEAVRRRSGGCSGGSRASGRRGGIGSSGGGGGGEERLRPTDVAELEALRPPDALDMVARLAAAVGELEKSLEGAAMAAASRPAGGGGRKGGKGGGKKRQQRRGGDSDDDDDDDGGDTDDSENGGGRRKKQWRGGRGGDEEPPQTLQQKRQKAAAAQPFSAARVAAPLSGEADRVEDFSWSDED